MNAMKGCVHFVCWLAIFSACAADNQLTENEKKNGWLLLFDGKTTSGWMNRDRTTPRTRVEDDSLNPHKAGHYMIVHTQQWENFIFTCDFKISKGCNSG